MDTVVPPKGCGCKMLNAKTQKETTAILLVESTTTTSRKYYFLLVAEEERYHHVHRNGCENLGGKSLRIPFFKILDYYRNDQLSSPNISSTNPV